MLEKITDKIVSWLLLRGGIEQGYEELYKYAVISGFMAMFPVIVAVVFGTLIGCIDETIVFIIPFMIIRKFSGGYHTKKLWTCLIFSVSVIMIFILMAHYIMKISVVVIGMFISIVCLIIFSPVDTENYRLSESERKDFHKIVVVLVMGCIVIEVLLLLMSQVRYFCCVSFGVILAAVLQLLYIIQIYISKYINFR